MSCRSITTKNYIITTGFDRQLNTYFLNLVDNRLDERIFDSLLMSDSRCLDIDSIRIILRGFGLTLSRLFWEEFSKDHKRINCGRYYRGYNLVTDTIQIGTVTLYSSDIETFRSTLSDSEIIEVENWFNEGK